MQRTSPDFPAQAAVWTVTDGHAGNVRQAEALAVALAGSFHAWTLQPRAPWRWLAPRRLPGATQAFGVDFATASTRPSLAIGCGRQAALATRLLRDRGARTVQILDPRIDLRHWDLVIAPEHDGLSGENVIPVIGSLHPVDDLWLATARGAFPGLGNLPGPRTAILLGGESAHARFTDDDYDGWLRAIARIVRAEGGSALATTSRRTPRSARARLQQRLGDLPGVRWTGEADGPNPYAGLLAWADRIVCTADSVNMVSEASATLAPVFVAGHDRVSGRPRRFLDGLLRSGRVRPLDATLTPYAVTPLRETARVAAEVRAWLDDRASRSNATQTALGY
ncbi:mitochondrial fission ELM1 family protein [Lysobacter sp. LF1]|uniref:Mitochondrial fission ELM1 family protein n=1 Tax=Lysobacter stagni TaxID=3045172 RepID=A0ABT6XBS6_9GAMM|nr:mitochondrial fission ELM1 family protein [Lysobacter sp. LF1]MDI9237591.1 mitochondrial fission ELM1 family protein [Lysobacter sp. LF1]